LLAPDLDYISQSYPFSNPSSKKHDYCDSRGMGKLDKGEVVEAIALAVEQQADYGVSHLTE
jgi:hypothetical protein